MKLSRIMRGLVAGVLTTTLLVAAVPATPAAPAAAVQTDVAGVEGQGLLAKAACIGCMAGILAAGGSSIIGLVVIAAAFPEAVALCGFGCAVAFAE